MPPEWSPQEAVWLSWPVEDPRHWGGAKREMIWAKFAEIAAAISRFETVRINAPAADHAAISTACNRAKSVPERIELFNHPHNDVWCRDHGPIFVKHGITGEVALTDWEFNAWGGKFPPWDLDNAIPEKAAAALKMERFTSKMILEGGAIETNGKGTLLTTEAVLLNPNRHGGKPGNKAEVEKELKAMLGVKDIVWFKKGIEGDDTDGHIDDIVRFIREDAVICMVEPRDSDPNHKVLKEIRERLDDVKAPDGGKLEIIEIEMPQAIEMKDWRLSRLPASYANFMIMNNAVLLPLFGHKKKDAAAEDKISECFPGREIISMMAKDLVTEGGAFHCIGMHQPK